MIEKYSIRVFAQGVHMFGHEPHFDDDSTARILGIVVLLQVCNYVDKLAVKFWKIDWLWVPELIVSIIGGYFLGGFMMKLLTRKQRPKSD